MFTETIALQDKVSAPAAQAAKQMAVLDSAIDKTEQALTIAAATGNVKKYQALSKDLTSYKAALDAIPPELKEQIAADKALADQQSKTAERKKAQAAIDKAEAAQRKAQLQADLKDRQAIEAQKLKDQQAADKALAKEKESALKEEAQALKEADAQKKALQDKALADGAHAMQVGKETIQAAVAGIKNAFSALASGDIKGAIAGVTDAVSSMAKMLDLVVPGLGQAVSTLVQIAGGMAGITAGLIKSGMALAIEAHEGKAAMLTYFDAMGQGVVTGAQTEEMIDSLKAKIGVAKDDLVGWTKQLQAMGMVDLGEIEKNLTAIASSTALMGSSGAQAFTDITKKIQLAVNSTGKLEGGKKIWKALADTGANVVDVAQQMGMSVDDFKKKLDAGTIDAAKFGDALQDALIKKGAGPLQRMASSLPNLKKLLSESIGDMFEDIDVGPFLAQVKSLFDIFGQGKASGQAMKGGIQGAFQGIFDAATKVVPYIKHFLLDLVILGLKAYIGLKPLIKWAKEMGEKQAVVDGLKNALVGIGLAVAAMSAPLVGAAAVVTLLVTAFGAASAMAASFVGAVVKLGTDVFNTLNGYIAQAISWGTNFVMGIVNGIVSGASAIVGAVTNIANLASSTFSSVLDMHSPSKVMALQGGYVAAGVAEGIDAGAPVVSGASANLAAATSGGFADAASSDAASGGSGASASKSGGGMQVTATIMFNGAVQGAQELTEQAVSLIFEKIALEQGL